MIIYAHFHFNTLRNNNRNICVIIDFILKIRVYLLISRNINNKLYKIKDREKKIIISAFQCLQSLYKYLIMPYLQQRYTNRSLRRNIIICIGEILKKDRLSESQETQRLVLDKRVRCAFCGRAKDNKTKKTCMVCERPICADHRMYTCTDCFGQD